MGCSLRLIIPSQNLRDEEDRAHACDDAGVSSLLVHACWFRKGDPAFGINRVRLWHARNRVTAPACLGHTYVMLGIRRALSRWTALTRYTSDGRLEMTNNTVEPAISDSGGARAAAIYTLIETAKMNGLNAEAYLRDVLPAATSRRHSQRLCASR